MADEEKKESASELMSRAMKNISVSKQSVTVTGIEKKEDFTEATKTTVAEATSLAQNGALDRAIEMLLALEKKCRLGNDISNLKDTVLAMVTLCREQNNWPKLNATCLAISKRQSQSKHAISVVVTKAMEWVEEAPDKPTKVSLLEALHTTTTGKVYVEAEHAKITRQLAAIKEENGDIDAAASLMLDVFVETYGSLSKFEKVDFILEQIRLVIGKQDWVRAIIVAKKVRRETLEEEGMEDLKLRFFNLLITFHLHEKDAFEVASSFYAIYGTPCILADDSPTGWRHYLKSTATFLVLAQHTPAQSNLLHKVAKDEKLTSDPELVEGGWAQLLTQFTTPEIIQYPLANQVVFEEHLKVVGSEPLFDHWRTVSHSRTTQHNLRVAAKYYTRIRTARLAHLLGLTTNEVEEEVSTLVSDGQLFAKIDRPAGIMTFKKMMKPEETLSDWASDVSTLLNLVERTCHLINKEHMIHKV